MVRFSRADYAELLRRMEQNTAPQPKRKRPADATHVLLLNAMFEHGRDLLADESLYWRVEYRFHPTREWRFDLACVNRKIAIEADGGQYAHAGGRHNTDGDREKMNAALVMGWRVFHFSRKQLQNPTECVDAIRAALRGE